MRGCILVAICLTAAQAAIGDCKLSGSVADENGAPVEGLFLAAYSTSIEQGHRTIEVAGSANTDDQGRYCITNLRRPGGIFLRTNEWFNLTHHRKLAARWYPDATGFASAKPLEPGTGTEANFTLASVPTFLIDGKFTGLPEAEGIDFHAETPDGIIAAGPGDVLAPLKITNDFETAIDPRRGTFSIEGSAAGEWTFVFTAVVHNVKYEARLRSTLDRDRHGVVLAFAPAPVRKIELTVHGQQFQTDSDFTLYQPGNDRGIAFGFPASDLEPGAYKMNVQTPLECVESFSPGDVELSGGNLVIAARNYARPISIEVGEHCAQLTIRLPDSTSSEPMIVLVPESLPFRPITAKAPAVNLPLYYHGWPLSPGAYRVYAFDTLDGVEYENPAVLSRFSGEAVTLEAGKTAEIRLGVVNRSR